MLRVDVQEIGAVVAQRVGRFRAVEPEMTNVDVDWSNTRANVATTSMF